MLKKFFNIKTIIFIILTILVMLLVPKILGLLMLLFASFLLVPLGKLLSNSLVGPVGGIAIGLGGILMGIGSTVSSDARNGNAGWVTFGMMLICIGTIVYIIGYWSNRFGKK